MKGGRKGKIAIYNRDFLHKTTLLRFLLIEISKKKQSSTNIDIYMNNQLVISITLLCFRYD